MHSELPGPAMNSHFGSIGNSAAALAAIPKTIAAATPTSPNTRPLTFLILGSFSSALGRACEGADATLSWREH
jgi:hypothetical protein